MAQYQPTSSAATRVLGSEVRGAFEEISLHGVALARALTRASSATRNWVQTQAQMRPYATLGVTLAAGTVLGAGLPPRLRFLLLRAAEAAIKRAVRVQMARLSPFSDETEEMQ